MDQKQAFGLALRELRADRQFSQDALAASAGLDRTFISLLEVGQRSPTLTTLSKICTALSVPMSALIWRMEQILQEKNGT